MDAWSDFTAKATRIDPEQVDWNAVAQGAAPAWLRQRPGPHNAMGKVKFMLPNELGIYLHDTPSRELFALDQRHLSAGCVRLEDAERLGRWLYRSADVGPRGPEPEQRVDLPTPVPVYILYLTAMPKAGVVEVQQDAYGRDRQLLSSLAAGTDERRRG